MARRRGGHGSGRARRRDRRREAAVEDAVEIADAQRAEHQDLGADAGGPQRGALLDVGAREQVCSRILERPGHLRRAMTVGVRLHDGDDARCSRRPPLPQMLGDRPKIRLERPQIHPRHGRPHPLTHAAPPRGCLRRRF